MMPNLRIAEYKGRKRSVNLRHKKKLKGLTKTNYPSPISCMTQIIKYSLCYSFKTNSYDDEKADGKEVTEKALLC
jgi:hypothetical protein